MRTTYWVPRARGRGISLTAAALALLCFAGTMAVGSPARAAEVSTADNGLLTAGAGYTQPEGSTRVREIQRHLRTLGLRPGPVDGLFGPATKAAVASFQRTAGLAVDGIVGPDTRRALRRASGPALGHGAGYDHDGKSTQVRKLQRRLRTLGLRPGPIDGLYGPRTAAAVARFQRARKITADGVAWFRTRRAIASADGGRVARTSDKQKAQRTTDEETSSRRAGDASRGPEGTPVAALKRAGSPGEGDAPWLPILVLGGLLAFAAATLARPVVSELAVSAAGLWQRGPTPEPDHADRRTSVPPEPPAGDSDAAAVVTPRPVEPIEMRPRQEGEGTVEAVGYVSTSDATDPRQLGLREQIAAMDERCEERGWRLIEVARDIGEHSGAALDRPGLAYALERLSHSATRCLIVAELRRLGNSAVELGHVLRWLRDRDLRLVAVDVDLDTAAPDGRIAADALISVGERERVGGHAVRDLPELREHIVAMRSAGMTLQAIADRLNHQGVPTLRGGREWRPSSVQAATGYRRPGQISTPRGVYFRSGGRRGRETR
jgi:peptidoglycan hydrolase-like protein with peptidoglycan-binding domain